MNDNIYYVYKLIDPRNKQPFYVGKGQNDRWKIHLKETIDTTDNKRKFYKIQKILRLGLEVKADFVQKNMNEDSAYDLEAEQIQKYGRQKLDENGILTNICLDNRPPNTPKTEKQKQELSARMMGNTFNTGRIQSTSEKCKRSDTLRRIYANGERVVTNKMRETTRRVHTGKIVRKETRKQLSQYRKGKSWEEVYGKEKADTLKKKQSDRQKGNPSGMLGHTHTEETKQKQREWTIKNKSKPVTIDGIYYSSTKEAKQKTDLSIIQIRKMRDKIK